MFAGGKKKARRALEKAQVVNMERKLKALKGGARSIVHVAAVAAGTVGASPIPGSDAPLIAAVQSAMIYKINTAFNLDISTAASASVVAGILSTTAVAQVGKTIVSNALKFIPIAGSIIGGAVSSATAITLTEAVGHAYIEALASFFDPKTGKIELSESVSLILLAFKNGFHYSKS